KQPRRSSRQFQLTMQTDTSTTVGARTLACAACSRSWILVDEITMPSSDIGTPSDLARDRGRTDAGQTAIARCYSAAFFSSALAGGNKLGGESDIAEIVRGSAADSFPERLAPRR